VIYTLSATCSFSSLTGQGTLFMIKKVNDVGVMNVIFSACRAFTCGVNFSHDGKLLRALI
jgi:hypothetical protein